jgi:hypothetical protein
MPSQLPDATDPLPPPSPGVPVEEGCLLQFDRIIATGHDHAAVRSLADAAFQQPILSVTHKSSPPPSGDVHDFQSIGPYWWPDALTPDGLPYIRRDGEVNPEFYDELNDRPRLERLAKASSTLALAALVTKHRPYADRAATLIRGWFLDPATRMNPHLLFGQAIPGRCSGRGIGIIDTRFFIDLIDAALIAEQFGHDFSALRRWIGEYLDWMLTHPYGHDERSAHNNHGTWYDTQAVAFALFAGRPAVAREILDAVPAERIEKHIDVDGRQPHEIGRTRSFTYSCVNLEALFWLAWLGRHVGVDLWQQPRLRRAIDFLAAYADPATPWPHPELKPEPHLPLPRSRLTPLLRQAAVAWREPRYRALAEVSGEDDILSQVRWPRL